MQVTGRLSEYVADLQVLLNQLETRTANGANASVTRALLQHARNHADKLRHELAREGSSSGYSAIHRRAARAIAALADFEKRYLRPLQ